MNLKTLTKLAEPKTFTASILPVAFGSVIAWTQFDQFHFVNFILLLIGMCLVQSATNMINDYHDYKRSSAESEKGDEKALVNGDVTLPQLKNIIIGCLLLAACIGVYFAAIASLWILAVMALASFVMVAYSAGPMPISYTPLGEAAAGLTMGLGITATVIYIQAGIVNSTTLLFCLPTVCLIAGLLLANNLSDWREDKMAGRKTSVICLGPDKATVLWLLLMITPLLVTLYLSLTGVYHWLIAGSVVIGFPYALLIKFRPIEKQRSNKGALMGITTMISIRFHLVLMLSLILVKLLKLS